MTQTPRNTIKIVIKNEIKKLFNPNCEIEKIERSDGSIEFRSCKMSEIDNWADTVANKILKDLDS